MSERIDARRLDQFAVLDILSDTPSERLYSAKAVRPEEAAIANEIECAGRHVVSVAQHGKDEFVIRQCFVDKTFSRRIDRDDARLRAVGHRVRENALAAILTPKARRRHPVRRARDARAKAGTGGDSDTQAVSAASGSRGGKSARPVRQQEFAKIFVAGAATGRNLHTFANRDEPCPG